MLMVVEEHLVPSLIDRNQAIGLIEDVYRAAAEGKAELSRPASMSLRGQSGTKTGIKVKGAVLDRLGVSGLRLMAKSDTSPAKASSYVYVLDSTTGEALGLVSERWLYRFRTAITGLVTCRALLPSRASHLALIGTGRIAEEFVRACHLVLPGLSILLASRSSTRAAEAAAEWQALTPSPLHAAQIKDAVKSADVVVTLSDANERLFSAEDLKSNALICGMGGRHEFDSDVLAAARNFIIDELEFVCTAGNGASWINAGQIDLRSFEARVDATIGEVLLGRKTLQREGRTLALIQGMASCDLALAKAVLDRAASSHH